MSFFSVLLRVSRNPLLTDFIALVMPANMRRASSVDPTASFGSERFRHKPEVELSLMETSSKPEDTDKQSLKPQLSRRPGFNGAVNNIALAIIVITVPFLVFIGLLLYLVFKFRVRRGDLSPNLQLLSDADDTNVYFVNYSATRLTTIASWASNVATILPGFVLTMSSYHLANIYLAQSKKAENCVIGARSLPTPYQLGLLLDMLDGKITAVWNVMNYYFWKKRERLNVRTFLDQVVSTPEQLSAAHQKVSSTVIQLHHYDQRDFLTLMDIENLTHCARSPCSLIDFEV